MHFRINNLIHEYNTFYKTFASQTVKIKTVCTKHYYHLCKGKKILKFLKLIYLMLLFFIFFLLKFSVNLSFVCSREKLAAVKLNRYKDDLLFFMFYNNVGDVLQVAAATEL